MKAQKGPEAGVFEGMLHKGNVCGSSHLRFVKIWREFLTNR
jgi:hypothetical protein